MQSAIAATRKTAGTTCEVEPKKKVGPVFEELEEHVQPKQGAAVVCAMRSRDSTAIAHTKSKF
jgi:hypothetical protein